MHSLLFISKIYSYFCRMKMKKLFHIFWLLLFLQAALEVNACGIENTFDDEYDTYTTAATVSIPNPVDTVVGFDFYFTCVNVHLWNCFGELPGINIYNYYPENSDTFQPPPINILHSVWII